MEGLLDPEKWNKSSATPRSWPPSRAEIGYYCWSTSTRRKSSALASHYRDGVILHEGKTNTLRRFKEDVKEVKEGFECGLTIEKWQDIVEGDIFEFYQKKEVARTL